MRQTRAQPSYGLVGSGQAARHFGRYLRLRRIPFKRWTRRSGVPAEKALADCGTILLLIKDDALAPFIKAHPFLKGKRLVHFSGSLTVPGVVGLHPLVSFAPKRLSLKDYERIAFISETGGPSLQDIFPRLKNPSYGVLPRMKPYYHALCVMAGNFPVLLWRKFFREFSRVTGAPASAAKPYLDSVLANLGRGPSAVLSGPFARRDAGTIRRNAAALKGDSYQPVYRAFARAEFRRTK